MESRRRRLTDLAGTLMPHVHFETRVPRTSLSATLPRNPALRAYDRVVQGDAREVLARLPRESVHLAITSPPYNLGIQYAGYSDDRTHNGYRAWLRTVWIELYQVLVPGGRFALNVAPTSIKDFRPIHHELTRDLRDLGFILRTEIIWYKQTMGRRTAWGSWRSPSNPHIVPSWEYVLVFSKGQWKLPGDRALVDITAKEFETFSDGFWAIPPERRRKGHPAPFPEELIERLIKFYSFRGNVVLDMFGGTGTVAAVARRLGRHYLHIDTSAEYAAVATERVREATPPSDHYIPPPHDPRRLVRGSRAQRHTQT
ncbi:MAG: site-specific DNA-methyltransferase [Thermoplasmata archaeon]